ncbi:MAG TPA: PKD domain-containing protein [Flavobacteriales bacterium]|nr:PKD domain-containing protein [Flavobacteriales bacterium]
MRLLTLVIMLLALFQGVKATHIVGGEMYYDCLGGDDYRITLKVYRDCSTTTGALFDDPLPLTIYDAANNLVTVVNIPLTPYFTIPPPPFDPCLTPPPVCIEVATYSTVVNLPAIPGGYTIVYQRCCRNPGILNMTNPNSTGMTSFIKIPDPAVVSCNSSARFNNLPPTYICAYDLFTFDHSATDPDGDSLVYDFYTPFEGGSLSSLAPNPSTSPPFVPVTWVAGYSQNNQINGAPNLGINTITGEINVAPSVLGIHIYGIKVSEYRGGVLIGESMREFQVIVTNCNIVVANVDPQTAVQLCAGLTLNFTNTSIGALTYSWDFGDTTTTTDVSSLTSPSYTYPDTGTYYVTLIGTASAGCADTSVVPFEVHLPLNVSFPETPPQCINTNSFDLFASGNFTSNALITWTLPMASTPLVYSNPALDIIYPDSGKYIATVGVSEFGCTDIYSDTLFVYPLPVIGMTYPLELACEPYSIQFTDTTLSWSPVSYSWNFGDGATSTLANPSHTYLDTGYFDLTFTINVDTICIATQTIFIPDAIHVYPSPDANFHITPTIQSVFTPTVEVTDLTSDDVIQQIIYYMDGDSTLLDFDTHYYHDTGWYNVYQWVVNVAGCTDTAVHPIYIIPETTIYIPNAFTPNGDGINDVFIPVVRDTRKYLLMIFDRWGEIIWQTDNPLQGWDGTLKNKRTKVDTYVYKVKYMDQKHVEHILVGHVTLVR